MADIPLFLTNQTQEEILTRMLNAVPDDLDKSEGSYVWDANAPASIELTMAAEWIKQMLKFGFITTAASDEPGDITEWVDLRAAESGMVRRPAVKSTGVNALEVIGAANRTYSLKGRRVASPADPDAGTEAIFFTVDSDVTTDASGRAISSVTAVEGGKNGNVPAGAINLLVDTDGLASITSITNILPTTGGLDTEDDITFVARVLQRKRLPSAGGNRADYVNWALEVPGVGGVSVIPEEFGPNTVGIYIIDSNKAPAGSSLVQQVQDYILDPRRLEERYNSAWTLGPGATVEGQTVKLTGTGTIYRSLENYILQMGTWMFQPHVKVSSTAGTSELVEFGVFNKSTNNWAVNKYEGAGWAHVIKSADQLTTDFQPLSVDFYWNYTDILEWRINRLSGDPTTEVTIDLVRLESTFSSDEDNATGRSPIGARLYTRSAVPVSINVSASLVISAGYDAASVRATVTAAITEYIRSVAMQDDNDVRYSRIAQAIGTTLGVDDYQNLTVNGGTANITITNKQVAVLGVVDFT